MLEYKQSDARLQLINSLNTGNRNGLSWPLASVFIVGEMAGSGLLAIPFAVESTGYAGFVLLVVFCVMAAITGILLGKCWNILQERYEEYREHCVRDPFASIGFRAFGKPGRYAVSVVNDITMFGGGVVFTILASQLTQSLVGHLNLDLSFCFWILVVAGALIPLSWLGTPNDMWPVAIIASCATIVAAILITVDAWLMKDKPTVTHGNVEIRPFLMAFGTMAFTYAGHPAFPTIQNDMKEPKMFKKSAMLAFLILFMIYLPVAVTGFLVLGDKISDNILVDINKHNPGPIIYTVQILIVVHLIFAFVIVTNPLFQELEELLKSPLKFHWKRVLIRTCMIGFITFVAESIPRFGAVLSLLGGSTISIQTFVFPPLFYMKLRDNSQGESSQSELPFLTRIVLILIMVIGVLCGGAATYSAIATIVNPDTFVLPCYISTNISVT